MGLRNVTTKRNWFFECSVTISALVNIIRIFLVFIISYPWLLVFFGDCFWLSLAQFNRLDSFCPLNFLIWFNNMENGLNRLLRDFCWHNCLRSGDSFRRWKLIFGARLSSHLSLCRLLCTAVFLINRWLRGCSSGCCRWRTHQWW